MHTENIVLFKPPGQSSPFPLLHGWPGVVRCGSRSLAKAEAWCKPESGLWNPLSSHQTTEMLEGRRCQWEWRSIFLEESESDFRVVFLPFIRNSNSIVLTHFWLFCLESNICPAFKFEWVSFVWFTKSLVSLCSNSLEGSLRLCWKLDFLSESFLRIVQCPNLECCRLVGS